MSDRFTQYGVCVCMWFVCGVWCVKLVQRDMENETENGE